MENTVQAFERSYAKPPPKPDEISLNLFSYVLKVCFSYKLEVHYIYKCVRLTLQLLKWQNDEDRISTTTKI